LSGQRGNSFMQQAVARGMQSAGENGGAGAMNMGFMGMGLNMAGNGVGGLQQPVGVGGMQQAPVQQAPAEDPVTKLKQMKELLDAGIISQEEFDAAKAKFLG
ncbi:MAG: SHOCT domain-containing protein, partial [Acetatifactor sp.]|nr:SHOCT domain-containing protein [Acetatifactor sp.]